MNSISGLSVPRPPEPPLSAAPPPEKAHNTAALPPRAGQGPAAAPPAAGDSPLPRTLAGVLASLGLPADRLSGAIVSFARFFSLPLEPALLAKIRRQTGLAGQAPQPETAAPGHSAGAPLQRGREALSLAALAAADKGVELTGAGLEDYAAAIDPDHSSKAEKTGSKAPPDSPGDGGRAPEEQCSGRQPEGQSSKKREDRPRDHAAAIAGDPSRLKAAMLEAAEQNPLLNLLNRLPGKNGQRWVVFPFSFTEAGAQYRVSLRILLPEGSPVNLTGRLALEIIRSAADSGPAEQRWLFVLDRTGGKKARLEVRLWPPRSGPAARTLVRDLSSGINLPPESISLMAHENFSPLAAETLDDLLLSVDKAV